jgi:hypothetical protein
LKPPEDAPEWVVSTTYEEAVNQATGIRSEEEERRNRDERVPEKQDRDERVPKKQDRDERVPEKQDRDERVSERRDGDERVSERRDRDENVPERRDKLDDIGEGNGSEKEEVIASGSNRFSKFTKYFTK